MAAFAEAIATTKVENASNSSSLSGSEASAVYRATIDGEWSVFGKPHGGYLLAVVLNAVEQHQRSLKSPHCDPAHVVSQFLTATAPGEAHVHVKVVRTGKSWTNIEARLVQKNAARITAQLLYTRMPDVPALPHEPYSTSNQNLFPATPSQYARPSPFVTHPSRCQPDVGQIEETNRRWAKNSVLNFVPNRVKWAEDFGVRERRFGHGKQDAEHLELEWAAWLEMTGEQKVDQSTVALWTDIMGSLPELFPGNERVDPSYYPTLAMSIHFHAKIPTASDGDSSSYLSAPRTIGCYARGGPVISQGRFEQLVEVWTAPGPIGHGPEQADWRRRCLPLATSTQLALTVSADKIAPPKL